MPNVTITGIYGVADAICALHQSKRNLTTEKRREIWQLVFANTTATGQQCISTSEEFLVNIEKLEKYGVHYGHTTLLRYINIGIHIEGLHRGGQDDLDAHAKRMDNRIVRASTRLATFDGSEKSDYYQGKILYTEEVLNGLGIELPALYTHTDGQDYVKTDWGYVVQAHQDDQDAKRGLYPLAIPSDCIFQIQYPELCHIVQFRDRYSHAHPELRQVIEQIKTQLTVAFPMLGKNLTELRHQPRVRK